jgi:hypothetical protein
VWCCNAGLTLQAAAVAATSPHLFHGGKKKFRRKKLLLRQKKSLSFEDNKQLVVHRIYDALRFFTESHGLCEKHVTADEQVAE